MTLFHVKPKMLALLQMGGARTLEFTTEQIINFLGKYIETKKLYDPQNKRIIHCKNDLLGEVFQLDEFVVGDFKSLWKCISPYLSLALKKEDSVKDQAPIKDSGECSSTTATSSSAELPWWYFVKKRNNDDSDLSQTPSRQSYDVGDTIEVHDTVYGESEPEFFEEYEPVYSDDSDDTIPVSSDEDDSKPYDIEYIRQISYSSDDEGSSDGDDFGIDWDIGFEEWWKCLECDTKNMPTVGYCMRCWKLRKGWATNQRLLSRSVTEPIASLESKVELVKSSSIDVMDGLESKAETTSNPGSNITPVIPSFPCSAKRKTEPEEASGEIDSKKAHLDDAASPMQASLSLSTLSSNDDEIVVRKCNICQNNRNDGVIAHGRTSHQYCCYKCAKRLQKKKKPCPVCREPIAAVLRNFIVQQ